MSFQSNTLQVPPFPRAHAISPPCSPPYNWEQSVEPGPNQTVFSSDLEQINVKVSEKLQELVQDAAKNPEQRKNLTKLEESNSDGIVILSSNSPLCFVNKI